MNTTLMMVLLVGLIVVLAILFFGLQMRRSNQLRHRFGPEYDRAVDDEGGRRKAEAELRQREKRIHALDIKPLSVADRSRFTTAWRRIQADFVDDPNGAVGQADKLLGEVMAARGYPVSDFDQRAADLSVDHPVVIDNYRAAHEIALRHARGQAGTEDLRQAMIHYRTLFEDLTDQPGGGSLQAAS